MEITEPHGPRFELALDRFRDGHAFTLNGVGFWLAPDGALEVSAQTSWFIENVTEQRALDDLDRARRLTDTLIEESPAFASLVKGRPRRYVLIDDYKMGGVVLCRLVDGSLNWSAGMSKSRGEI